MMNLFLVVAFASLINAGLILLFYKWRFMEYYEIHRKKWMPKKCEFCLFFWLALVELTAIFLHYVPFDTWAYIMIVPFALAATVLSRFFIQNHSLVQ